MQRIVTILLVILVVFNIYAFLMKDSSALLVGYAILMPMIGIFYGFSRNWEFTVVDKFMYFAYALGGISDISIIINYNNKGELIQIILACVVHLVFIVVFQKEGTHVYSLERKNLLKLLIPAVFVFFFFGFVLLKVIPDAVFLVTVLYAFELFILVVLGYFRPVNKKSYWIGVIGVSLILVKDVFYSDYHFINQDVMVHSFMDITNAISYYLIAWSVAMNQNDKSTVTNYVGIVTRFLKFLKKTNLVKFFVFES